MARLAGKKKISLSEMSQTINLRNKIKRKPSTSELREFAEEAIELINERTLSNNKVGGGAFAPYSENYAAKKGVSIDSVDLFLEGDMLGSLDYDIDEDRGSVIIKVEGANEIKKGYNHHVGDTLPKRPWFGLTSDEVKKISDNFKQEEDQEQQQRDPVNLRDLEREVRGLEFLFEEDE